MWNKIKRIYIGTQKVRPSGWLPSAYQEVEWIQSSGTQCINTNYAENKNFKIEMDIQFTSTSPTQQRLFWHSASSDLDSWCVSLAVYINGSRQWSRYVSDGGWSPQSTNISADTNRHLFVLDNSRLVIYTNGTSIYNWTNSTTVTRTNTRDLYLLCDYNINESSTYGFAKAKLYSCKIYDNNVLVRNFIPCYRKSDNVIWLLDKVENKFYTNAGTWTFTKWPDVN